MAPLYKSLRKILIQNAKEKGQSYKHINAMSKESDKIVRNHNNDAQKDTNDIEKLGNSI